MAFLLNWYLWTSLQLISSPNKIWSAFRADFLVPGISRRRAISGSGQIREYSRVIYLHMYVPEWAFVLYLSPLPFPLFPLRLAFRAAGIMQRNIQQTFSLHFARIVRSCHAPPTCPPIVEQLILITFNTRHFLSAPQFRPFNTLEEGILILVGRKVLEICL